MKAITVFLNDSYIWLLDNYPIILLLVIAAVFYRKLIRFTASLKLRKRIEKVEQRLKALEDENQLSNR